MPVSYTHTHRPKKDYWIGAADYDLIHVFRWMDGEPLNYTRATTKYGQNQQALQWMQDNLWHDYYATSSRRYICQSTPGLCVCVLFHWQKRDVRYCRH